MNSSSKHGRKSSRVSMLRNALALIAFASLTGGTELRAVSSTFTTTAVNAGTGADFNFDNAVNWTNGVPGVAGAGAAAPATLTSTDTATFYAAATTITGGTTITLANTHNILNLITAQGGGSLVIGSTAGPAFYLSDGGLYRMTGNLATIAAPTVLVGSANFDNPQVSSSRVFSISGAVTGSGVAGATLTLSSVGTANNVISGKIGGTATGANSVALVKNGVGVWLLSNAANTYTGGTSVNAGILNGGGGNGLSTGNFGTGTVTLNGGTIGVTFNGTTAGANNYFNNALVVPSGATGTVALRGSAFPNVTFAPASLTGTGTLILSPSTVAAADVIIGAGLNGTNTRGTFGTAGAFGTFGGTIQVSPGNTTSGATTLNLSNANALAATTGLVSVATGGTLTSSVGNAISGSSVSVAGGALTPNGTSVGMLTLSAGKTFTMTTGTLGLTITGTGTGNFDQIVGTNTGTFSLTGGTIDLTGSTFATIDSTYQILSGFTGGTNMASNLTYTGLPVGYTASLDATGLLTIVVPEPSTWVGSSVLFGLLLTGKLLRRRSKAESVTCV